LFLSLLFHIAYELLSIDETPTQSLCALTTDAAGKVDVLGHDCHTLSVDGAEVGVLEQTNEVSFSSLLKGTDGSALEAEVGLEVLCDLANKTLER
jgi:histone H3